MELAALSVGQCWCRKKRVPSHDEFRRSRNNFTLLSCKGRAPDPEEKKDDMVGLGGKLKLSKWKMLKKVGKRMKQNLSPQQKGDWKDLLLMSISFALYVYISQMLVRAYFAWSSMPKPMSMW
ncbi:hypothetical protein VNO78_04984 [Psophocarpus tetragonolobus]|uniref:Uncharacterized protein n=1 Tax=Psophocarpus tetragonolobus TaxID=3891 RepID=A0AAN9SZ09_PSOTE